MIGKRGKLSLRLFAVFMSAHLVVIPAAQAAENIYKYIDSDGILYFTNVPVASDYHVYVQTERLPGRSTDRYDRIIEGAARDHELPFSLLKAVIKAESNFDPSAVSRMGAQGLMQIMPETCDELGVSNPFDPEENINGGARYLRRLLTVFDGRLPLALAAYNAGPEAVSRCNGIPSFRETQEFVRSVMNYYHAFRQESLW